MAYLELWFGGDPKGVGLAEGMHGTMAGSTAWMSASCSLSIWNGLRTQPLMLPLSVSTTMFFLRVRGDHEEMLNGRWGAVGPDRRLALSSVTL
jgi:hypothetical protein